MTWTETHRRTDALREIEEYAAADPTGTLPWRAEYVEIFGDPDRLVALIRSRWTTRLQARLDPHVREDVLTELDLRLAGHSAGMLRILERYDRDQCTEQQEGRAVEHAH